MSLNFKKNKYRDAQKKLKEPTFCGVLCLVTNLIRHCFCYFENISVNTQLATVDQLLLFDYCKVIVVIMHETALKIGHTIWMLIFKKELRGTFTRGEKNVKLTVDCLFLIQCGENKRGPSTAIIQILIFQFPTKEWLHNSREGWQPWQLNDHPDQGLATLAMEREGYFIFTFAPGGHNAYTVKNSN